MRVNAHCLNRLSKFDCSTTERAPMPAQSAWWLWAQEVHPQRAVEHDDHSNVENLNQIDLPHVCADFARRVPFERLTYRTILPYSIRAMLYNDTTLKHTKFVVIVSTNRVMEVIGIDLHRTALWALVLSCPPFLRPLLTAPSNICVRPVGCVQKHTGGFPGRVSAPYTSVSFERLPKPYAEFL